MERLAELISKLKEQFDKGADSSKLLATTLLIERELMKLESAPMVTSSTSKVAVVMPAARNGYHHPAAETLFAEEESAEVPQTKETTSNEFSFDPLTEIPTLSQQHSVQEINEMLGIRDASLNDKLKEYKEEIGQKLTGHPIKDLKKAIGINDRFVFISELFRGDEAMYERSLKTINSFHIYAEAEYWIERELKVKLGWLDSNDATKQFYQLVRRRFA
ncbi:MAG: hypothetical protein J7497_05965 [Chitinophagaceae bacterium]|nr:hypothetical protein [Chitinophagaceae bacterium]